MSPIRAADPIARKRRKLEGQRERIASEGFDELSAELVDDAARVRERLDDVLGKVGDVAREWEALRAAWLALERGAGLSQRMRLDIPAFPLDLGGDLEPLPIPHALNSSADPVIRSEAFVS